MHFLAALLLVLIAGLGNFAAFSSGNNTAVYAAGIGTVLILVALFRLGFARCPGCPECSATDSEGDLS